MLKPSIRIFEVVDEKDFLAITFYRRYAEGMDNALISMIVIAGLLLFGILLSFIFLSAPASVALSVVIGIILVLVLIGVYMNLRSRKEIQKIEITRDRICLTKGSDELKTPIYIQRKDFQYVQLDDPDKMDSWLEMLIFMISPAVLVIMGITQREPAPALYTNHGKFRFFEFGTKAQKIWIMKSIINFLNRTAI